MKRFKTFLMLPLSAAVVLSLAACSESNRASREQQTGEAAREGEPWSTGGAVTPGETSGTMGQSGQQMGYPQSGSADRVTGQDQTFLTQAIHGNMAEIEMARMVQARGARGEVRDFAEQLISDHEKANQQLMDIARQGQVTVATALPDDKRQHIEQMRGLSGDQLGRRFLDTVAQAHQESIQQYRQISDQAQNSKLKEYASSHLPKLEEHLRKAQKLQGHTGSTGADRRR